MSVGSISPGRGGENEGARLGQTLAFESWIMRIDWGRAPPRAERSKRAPPARGSGRGARVGARRRRRDLAPRAFSGRALGRAARARERKARRLGAFRDR